MDALNINKIYLDDITLEKVDITKKEHLNAVEEMRDYVAKEMCYDIKTDIAAIRKGGTRDNFLIRQSQEQNYIGYINISENSKGENVLCYIVKKQYRNRGFGKIILTSISDYLLENNILSSIQLYISRDNPASSKIARSCGFEPKCYSGGSMIKYQKVKVNK